MARQGKEGTANRPSPNCKPFFVMRTNVLDADKGEA